MTRRALQLLLLIAVALVAAVTVNTLRQGSRQLAATPLAALAVDEQAAAERLAAAVRFRTISYEQPSAASQAEFLRLHEFLAQAFPHAHAALTREIVRQYSLLFTWHGRDPAAAPIVLMAHQDVVPVAPGTESRWQSPPFAGEVKGGFVWGRGTWDDKGSLMAIFEAVERLRVAGFTPHRTVYLAFGHDEEIGGSDGASTIATMLQNRGVHPEFVLDEGMLILSDALPGLARPAALIGIAEKGAATLRLTATAPPGHSSMPGPRSAIGALAAALTRLERAPMPGRIGGVAAQMFDTVAPEMRGANRVLLSNRWLFGPLIASRLTLQPSTNAAIRTTTALTVVQGGNKDNVLPGEAQAWVNFRLLPGDTIAAVVQHARNVIGDDTLRIDVTPGAAEASPVATTDSIGFRLLSHTIHEVFPDAVVAPSLMVAATDSRHMGRLTRDVYRFVPVRASTSDLSRFHGTDERISIGNYADMIRFYQRLISSAAGDP